MAGVTLDELLKKVGIPPSQLDEECTSEHIQDIALFLESWRTVIPRLGLSKVQVEEVESDGRAENEKRLKILECWKAKFAFKATYMVMVEALLKIGRADQAQQVCHVLVPQQPNEGSLSSSSNVADEQHCLFLCPCGECTIDSYFAHGCPKMPKCISTNGDRTFPYLDTSRLSEKEKQVLKYRLQKDTKSMIVKYAHLVTSTTESLQKQEVNPKDLAICVLSLELFQTQENDQPVYTDVGEKIRNASSIQDIILELVRYWSFYNYGVLEHIIKEKGTPEDKAKLQKYLEDLEKFCQRRIFEIPPRVYGNESNKENWAKFNVKLDDKIQKLQELCELQNTIAEILGLQWSTLYLRDITEGCVEVVFMIPPIVALKVFPLSDEQQNSLSSNHVVRNSCNLVHPQHYSEASNSKRENPGTSQPAETAIGEALSSREFTAPLKQVPVLPLPCSSAGVDALLATRTLSPPQQTVSGVQQPNPEVQLPPPQAHPHKHHPTPYIPTPYHQEKAPRPLSPHIEAEEELPRPDDDQYDRPHQSQLDHDATSLKMDESGSGSESAGVDALVVTQTQSPPQQTVSGVQQPNPEVQPPPPQAHLHKHHPTPYIPTPYHQEKAPHPPSPHVEAEEGLPRPDDNQYDRPHQSQLDHDATSLKMDGSGSGSESADALLATRTQSPPQQTVSGVHQPNPEVQPPPPQAHPHKHHPTPYIPTPYHQEKAPRPLSPHVEAEEGPSDDNQYDRPHQSQLDHDATSLKMDGSGSGSESAGVDALVVTQTQSPPQQTVSGVQQPNPEIQPPPPQAHPHKHHPTPYIPTPYHQEKAPRPPSPHVEAEEGLPDDDQYDRPHQSQLDHDATSLKIDGSGSGSESGQVTPPPEATPLTHSTCSTPLTPKRSTGADSPQPSPGVKELPSRPPIYQQLPSQPQAPTCQLPSQPQAPAYKLSSQPQAPTYQLPSQPQAPAYQLPSQPQASAYQLPSQPQAPAYQLPSQQLEQAPAYQLPSQPQAPAYQLPSQPQSPTYQLPSQPQSPTNQLPSQSQAPTYQLPSHPQSPTYQLPSQPQSPAYQLESVQAQPLSLEEEIKEFEDKYTNLVCSVLGAFQQASVSFSDVQAYLMALPISLQLQLGNLLQSKALQLSQASSISELFFILSGTPYWNFLNPSLLSHLVEHFGDERIKQQKDNYLEELRELRKRTKVDDFTGKWTGTSQPDTQELVVELKPEVWRKRTLEQLEQFRIRLSRIRSLQDFVLPFKVSSINVVFSLPKSIDGHNLHLEDLRKFFLAHQVLRVLLDGVCILDFRPREDEGEDQGETDRREQEGNVAHGGTDYSAAAFILAVSQTIKEKQQYLTQHSRELSSTELESQLESLKKDLERLEKEIQNLLTYKERDKRLKLTAAWKPQLPTTSDIGTDYSASTPAVSHTQYQKQHSKELSSTKHERTEKGILYMLTERLKPRKPHQQVATTPLNLPPEEDSEGMMFNPLTGGLFARKDVMVILSVGSEHPPGVRVEERVRDKARASGAFRTYGKLPLSIASIQISRETAADLKVVSSHIQKDITSRDVSLKLDIPDMQRPKEYYITAIANFLKQCRQPGAVIWYMGHSEKGTGNWCFKDGTISFQEIFDLYTTHIPGRLLTITSDCCYSGKWVHRCTETLDNKLGIPPCGHKAREQGVLIKVIASCRGDQKAAEPCFSTDGTFIDANHGRLQIRRCQLTEHQTTMIADFTKLVCCKDPGNPCPAEDVFNNWKWDEAVSHEMQHKIYLVRGKDRGRPTWQYVLLFSGDEDHVQGFKTQVGTGTIDVVDWGHRMVSGWGEDPPENIRDKLYKWTAVC